MTQWLLTERSLRLSRPSGLVWSHSLGVCVVVDINLMLARKMVALSYCLPRHTGHTYMFGLAQASRGLPSGAVDL